MAVSQNNRIAEENLRAFQPEAVFADGTEAFRSPCEPEPYDFVTLTLRVGKNQAVRTSVVITERAGRIDMDLRASDAWFDWYRAEIELIDKPLHYFFEVATANGVFRYDRLGVMLSDRETVCFQITPGFHTPDWAKGAVMYQIFVDRFCNGDPTNDVQTGEYYYIDRPTKEVTDWGRAPEACDVQEFYGGDLAGVIKKLDYLRRLGIEVIYLNPIFVSPSSHKYDIQDYDHVDPHFGVIIKDAPVGLAEGDTANAHSAQYVARVTSRENLEASNELFAQLVSEAHKRGIRVIIDGVFNHCGSFNKWMDREGIYRNVEGFEDGAYGSKQSPYRSFFAFANDAEADAGGESGAPGSDASGRDGKTLSRGADTHHNASGKPDAVGVLGAGADRCVGADRGVGVDRGAGADNIPGDDPYEGWWGLDTLPKLNYEKSPKLKNYIMRIARKWVSAPYGADGWRLDVAADLGRSEAYNHEFWKEFRRSVKSANPDALILAEHYGDASAWLQGDEWDSVMNYDAFMEPVGWFLTGMEKHSDAAREDLYDNEKAFDFAMRCNMARFQTSSLLTAMNELSNHDHSRFLTRTNRRVGRTETAGAAAADEGVNKAIMREAVMMQMTWPGAPCVYYGDEAGVCGWTDPDNRRTYPWGHEDAEMVRFHREMIRIHRAYRSLRVGSLVWLAEDYGLLAYARMLPGEAGAQDASAGKASSKGAGAAETGGRNANAGEAVITIINNTDCRRDVHLPVWLAGVADSSRLVRLLRSGEDGFGAEAAIYPVRDGYVTVPVDPMGGVVLKNLEY